MIESIILAIQLIEGKITHDGLRAYVNQRIPIQVIFTNTGKQPVCILNRFEPRPIFFSIQITDENGTIIDSPGGGKIAIDQMDYIQLRPNENFVHDMDIANELTSRLDHGQYTLSLIYHNQYGKDFCFRGYLTSNTVKFEVIPQEIFETLRGVRS